MSAPRLMNNWRVTLDKDEDEAGNTVTYWAVSHYVGGEHGWYLDNWFTTEAEANARRNHLNSNPICSFYWESAGDGAYNLRVTNTEETGV